MLRPISRYVLCLDSGNSMLIYIRNSGIDTATILLHRMATDMFHA